MSNNGAPAYGPAMGQHNPGQYQQPHFGYGQPQQPPAYGPQQHPQQGQPHQFSPPVHAVDHQLASAMAGMAIRNPPTPRQTPHNPQSPRAQSWTYPHQHSPSSQITPGLQPHQGYATSSHPSGPAPPGSQPVHTQPTPLPPQYSLHQAAVYTPPSTTSPPSQPGPRIGSMANSVFGKETMDSVGKWGKKTASLLGGAVKNAVSNAQAAAVPKPGTPSTYGTTLVIAQQSGLPATSTSSGYGSNTNQAYGPGSPIHGNAQHPPAWPGAAAPASRSTGPAPGSSLAQGTTGIQPHATAPWNDRQAQAPNQGAAPHPAAVGTAAPQAGRAAPGVRLGPALHPPHPGAFRGRGGFRGRGRGGYRGGRGGAPPPPPPSSATHASGVPGKAKATKSSSNNKKKWYAAGGVGLAAALTVGTLAALGGDASGFDFGGGDGGDSGAGDGDVDGGDAGGESGAAGEGTHGDGAGGWNEDPADGYDAGGTYWGEDYYEEYAWYYGDEGAGYDEYAGHEYGAGAAQDAQAAAAPDYAATIQDTHAAAASEYAAAIQDTYTTAASDYATAIQDAHATAASEYAVAIQDAHAAAASEYAAAFQDTQVAATFEYGAGGGEYAGYEYGTSCGVGFQDAQADHFANMMEHQANMNGLSYVGDVEYKTVYETTYGGAGPASYI
ncbi:hypothetical protein MFIFM68171_11078 [Madurella fahalii]|uniref:Uncharacterized protein n=1 Tax=Madurella fahalii TaxID=1157608 RepID=A0ABQ0GT02_9PEZI